MRYLIAAVAALVLSACASQEPVKTADAKPAAKAPQCWSGDHGRFFDVGATTSISGVEVACEKTSDGKNAQWMGKKR
jgi:outer membrane biogenesis lipoprotein LolB